MPSAVSNGAAEANIVGGNPAARPRLSKPLVYSGSLDNYKHADITPVIGREYEGLQVVDLLKADDQLIRDLAVTSKYLQLSSYVSPLTMCSVSQRGVVFLRDQDVTPTQMKDFCLRLTELAGCVSQFYQTSSCGGIMSPASNSADTARIIRSSHPPPDRGG